MIKNCLICILALSVIAILGMTMAGGWNRGNDKVWTDDRVGIGRSNPLANLDIKGNFPDVVYVYNSSSSGAVTAIQASSRSKKGTAILGVATSTRGANAGVQGTTDSLNRGFGVFSVGDSGATGAKLFRIDHPFDPANLYLNHFSAEGPEPYNIYQGTAVLDQNGSGLASLPDYFEAINRDFHYQLTSIGAPSPNLHVAAEIENNTFLIAGGAPGVKVSWTVTAVRNDRYMQAYAKPTVEDKEESRGTYLHPELYGQPKSQSVMHEMRRPEEQVETSVE